jgi:hypothetical protein
MVLMLPIMAIGPFTMGNLHVLVRYRTVEAVYKPLSGPSSSSSSSHHIPFVQNPKRHFW